MYKIIYSLFILSFSNLYAQKINCRIKINLTDKTGFHFSYINNGSDFYYNDTIGMDSDSLCLSISEPKIVTLFINNEAENNFQFYLDECNYEVNINCKNKIVSVVGSSLNDDYKEMMRVHDSMYKKYKIMHAMFYPYNGMDRDSAHEWIRKYLPLCDSLSNIHMSNFYQTHLNSFLTLEHIFTTLQYTFEDPGYDTTVYNIKELKTLFDKLSPHLKKYKKYDECVIMFNKEHIKPTETAKPLFDYQIKINELH